MIRKPLVPLLVALFLFHFGFFPDAHARGKRSHAASHKRAKQRAKQHKALAELMGGYRFGMSKKQVLDVLGEQVGALYGEKIAATSDVYLQDKLRSERDRHVANVGESFVEFRGDKTGWDVSLIDDQFAHHTGESMLVLWETYRGRDQRRFFFFYEGRLYKMLIALNATAMEGSPTFAQFAELLEKRFGPPEARSRASAEDNRALATLEWTAPGLRVMTLDRSQFYGAFCLLVGQPRIMQEVAAVRARHRPEKKETDPIIRAITSSGDDLPTLDEGAGTIDEILNSPSRDKKR